MVTEIEEGQNNQVWQGFLKKTGGRVAIKAIDASKYHRLKHKNGISESQALKVCHGHKNVLGIVEKFLEDGHIFIVTKFSNGGDLSSIFQNLQISQFKEKQAQYVIRQVA